MATALLYDQGSLYRGKSPQTIIIAQEPGYGRGEGVAELIFSRFEPLLGAARRNIFSSFNSTAVPNRVLCVSRDTWTYAIEYVWICIEMNFFASRFSKWLFLHKWLQTPPSPRADAVARLITQ